MRELIRKYKGVLIICFVVGLLLGFLAAWQGWL